MSQTPSPVAPHPASQPGDRVPAAPPGRTQKLVTRGLWVALLLAMLAVVAMKYLTARRMELDVLFHEPDFSLTDQNNHPFTQASLKEKVYVCDFIFTTCGSACPTMTRKMLDLQKHTSARLQFVSFTVNPEHDTPAVLKEYAAQFGADESRWHFLTGTPRQMADVARGMNVTSVPAGEDSPILHDEHFLLVDGDGNIRGVYSSKDPEAMKRLQDEASYVANSPGGRG